MAFIKLTFKNRDSETYEVDGPCKVELATTTTGLVSLGFHPESLIAVEFIAEATTDEPVINRPPADPDDPRDDEEPEAPQPAEKPKAKAPAKKPAAKK